ncbi:MAG: creatininase family protein, partial [Candidatus Lokiarchaeota archaeon]|nr:creatininase family protein [Candidatus Lokiarchaeota archaeon]
MRKLIIIPVGSYEQHGPHLPLDTDYLIAEKISESIANMYFGKINKGIQIGISTEHDGFEKTKSITQDQFINEIEKKINNLDKNAKLV